MTSMSINIDVRNYPKYADIEKMISNRIFSLDYLRGLCALSIMIYHYCVFTGKFNIDASNFLGRIGVYGVSIFYILSGLTLYLVYQSRFKLVDFYIKRFFRIYPLLWIAITLSIILYKIPFSQEIILWNYTGLFGIFKWWQYIGTGVWSIGNELFFYLMFPLLLVPTVKFKHWPLVIGVVIYAVYVWFAFEELTGNTLAEEWRDYINPLNQAGLFFTGFLIGYYFKRVNVNQPFAIGLLIISVLAFVFYPAEGNTITLVSGYNRIIFTVICAIITFSVYKIQFKETDLKVLGEASYSVYLLHPLVWFALIKFIPENIAIPVCIVVTLILSVAVYRFFEKPFMQLGRHLSNKLKKKQP